MNPIVERIARRVCCPGGCKAQRANEEHPDRMFQQTCQMINHVPDVRMVLECIGTPTKDMVVAMLPPEDRLAGVEPLLREDERLLKHYEAAWMRAVAEALS